MCCLVLYCVLGFSVVVRGVCVVVVMTRFSFMYGCMFVCLVWFRGVFMRVSFMYGCLWVCVLMWLGCGLWGVLCLC